MNARKMTRREREEMLDSLRTRFGFRSEIFGDYEFFINTKTKIFILNRTVSQLVSSYPKRLMNAGILFARRDAVIKPTSNMIQVFGRSAHRNTINLSRPRTRVSVEGFDIDFREEAAAESGYVILRYGSYNLGCGLFRDFTLKNMMPKAKRMRLKHL